MAIVHPVENNGIYVFKYDVLLYQIKSSWLIMFNAANLRNIYETIKNLSKNIQWILRFFLLSFCCSFDLCYFCKRNMKITKTKYLRSFLAITILLAFIRLLFPSVAKPKASPLSSATVDSSAVDTAVTQEGASADKSSQGMTNASSEPVVTAVSVGGNTTKSRFFSADGTPVKHHIISVPSYAQAFPDQNDVQLVSANKWGVTPVQNREEAESRKAELVYVGSNPYFFIDKLHSSIPYLVPRASVLLQDIGRSYFDSLQIKGIPLHKIIVTSVLRSKDDVAKLRGHNGNATQNSCHLYGTTFDVCYNRYKTVQAPGEQRREVRNDTLKWVLAEVLRDMREKGRCWVKYEVHQGCFHITVK